MKTIPKFVNILFWLTLVTNAAYASTKWPQIKDVDTSINIEANAYSIDFSIPLKDSTGNVIYTLFGTGGSEHYLDSLSVVNNINYVSPLQMRLVKGTKDLEESLLGYDGRPTWYTRGQVHYNELVGDSANSPEYGTLRRFRLRGMELILKFTDIRIDKTGLPQNFVLAISVRKCPDCESPQAELPDYLKGKYRKMWRGIDGAWYEEKDDSVKVSDSN